MTPSADLEALARAVAEARGARCAWALVMEDENGTVKLYSNVAIAAVQSLFKRWQRQERERER